MDTGPVLRDLTLSDLSQLRTWADDPQVVEIWPDLSAMLDTLEGGLREADLSAGPRAFVAAEPGGTPIGYAVLTGIDWGERKANLEIVIGEEGWWTDERCAEVVDEVLTVAFRGLDLARLTTAASPLAGWLLHGLEICGFRRAGFLDQPYYTGGKVWRMVCLSLMREQYELAQRLAERAREQVKDAEEPGIGLDHGESDAGHHDVMRNT